MAVNVMTEGKAISLYGPSHVELSLDALKPKAQAGTLTYVENTSSFRSHYLNLPAVGDYAEWTVALSPGTWVLALEAWQGASLGRVAVSVDGVQVGVVDLYDSASTVATRRELPGITVRQGGERVVRFTVAAKNALSAGTAVRLSHAGFTRQGPQAVPDAFDWTYKAAAFTPRSIGTDGQVYGNGGTGDRVLRRSADGGSTFEDGQDFGALVASGEYVIFATRTTDGYVVVTSTDVSQPGNSARIWFSTSFTSGFTAVQTIKGTNEFSISRPEVGTNGKTWLAVGEYSTDSPQPVHYLWHSSDGGQTWRNIKTATNADTTKNSHFHGCAHDPNQGMRLYSSQGDNGNNTFAYTDDPEAATPTWTTVTLNPHPQPTTLGVFPGRLFISPDHASPGIAGIWTLDTATHTPAEAWQGPLRETATDQFGRSPYAQSADGRAVVVIPDRLGGTLQAYFVATGDSGKTWHLIHTMPQSELGSASNGVVGPDAGGRIFYKAPSSNPAPAGTHLMVAPMPTFRPVP